MHRPVLIGLSALGISVSTAVSAELSVPGDHSTIQGAINAASTGDVILVGPGTYDEAITFYGKAVTLRSTDGPATTIIDAYGKGKSAVTCDDGEGPNTVLDGFTVTRGAGTLHGSRKEGGGMFIGQSSPTVTNCVFLENEINAWDFNIQGSGAGMFVDSGSPTVSNCQFIANELNGCSGWLNGGAGMHNRNATPTIVNCQFIDNDGNNGGGIMNTEGGSPTIIGCRFEGNVVTFSGGGLNNTDGASATVVNCLFKSNVAYHGAGLYATGSDLQVSNCTVVLNVATALAGGMYIMFGAESSSVANCIFYDNIAFDQPQNKEIVRYGGTTSTVNNSNVEGGWNGAGWANIDQNPLFANSSVGDFRLLDGSPSIDSGSNYSLPGDVDDDLDGNQRVVNVTVDMGAYEVQGEALVCPADLTSDGMVDVADLTALFSGWGACDACGDCPSDLTGDCTVDVDDLVSMMGVWGACEG